MLVHQNQQHLTCLRGASVHAAGAFIIIQMIPSWITCCCLMLAHSAWVTGGNGDVAHLCMVNPWERVGSRVEYELRAEKTGGGGRVCSSAPELNEIKTVHVYLNTIFIRAAKAVHRLQQVSIAQVQHCQLILQAQQHSCHLLSACHTTTSYDGQAHPR